MAAVFDVVQQQMRLYINGQLDGTRAMSASSSVPINRNLYIGGRNETGEGLKGLIDEVRLWNVARSAAEIQDNFRSGLAASTPGLVA